MTIIAPVQGTVSNPNPPTSTGKIERRRLLTAMSAVALGGASLHVHGRRPGSTIVRLVARSSLTTRTATVASAIEWLNPPQAPSHRSFVRR
jgi:hypothetical protein